MSLASRRAGRLALAFLCACALAAPFAARSSADDDVSAASLRKVAQAYCQEGDVEKALSALQGAKATASDLIATLRATQASAEEPVPGERTLEIVDDHGTKTDLLVVAPSAEAIRKRPKSGLGLAVLLHGLGATSAHMHDLARAVAATGECVAVAPSAKPLPRGEGGEDGVPPGGMFVHWWLYDDPHGFPMEAIRKARSLYPIDPDRVVMSGHSMGGYGSWNIGLRRPDVIAGIAPLAGGLSRKAVVGGVEPEETLSLLENGRLLPVFAVHGTKDNLVPLGPDERACKKIEELGGKVELRKLEGVGHMLDGVWAARGDTGKDLVKFLTTQKRGSSPEEVTYVSWNDRTDGAFWLRIAKRKAAGEGESPRKARLHGRVDRARNRVILEGESVTLARVYLDDRLLDLSRPVVVEAGGVVKFEGKVTPDLRSVLDSWRSRQDEKLVYPAYVEVDPRRFD